MIHSVENDFDSDCSTPTHYLERRRHKESTDQSFFTTIHSPAFRDTKCQLSFSSVPSATMTSIESSSYSFDETESQDLQLHFTSNYFRNDKSRNMVSHREPSQDGSTVFYDACDNKIPEERYVDSKSQASSITWDDQSIKERLSRYPENQKANRINRTTLPCIQPLYQQQSLQTLNQSYDGSYHVDLSAASTFQSTSPEESHIHDMSVHLQCSSDLSDLYSPSGVETILKPNSLDFSSIWNHLMNWRGKHMDNVNFCTTWMDSCQNPDSPLNMKQYYHHMHPFDDSYNSSVYKSPIKSRYAGGNGMKTEKRKNTLPNGHETNRNVYSAHEVETIRNEELNMYRTNLNECSYNQFNDRELSASYFDDSGGDEVDPCLDREIHSMKPKLVSNMFCNLHVLYSDTISFFSYASFGQKNTNTRNLNYNDKTESEIQNNKVCTKQKSTLKPPSLIRNSTAGTSASLSPSNTMQTNGTRHRRQNSFGCNTFTAESLAQIFDTRASSLEKSPTQNVFVPKTIKTVKKKNRLGVQDDDISPLDDDEDMRLCLRNRLSLVDVAVEDDSQCSPIHRKNEAFDFTNYSISTDLFGVKSDESPVESTYESTTLELKCHRGQYLPISREFVKEKDYKIEEVTFEGWVAFSKGTRLIDALLEDEKNIQRKDLRYIVLASGKLYVYASKMSYGSNSEILNKKVLKLRSDFTVSISSLSNQHGQCVMVRDNLGAVKCTILPVNISSELFCDDCCSEVVPIPEFRKQRHTLFAIHSTNHCDDKWLTDLSRTVSFEQNTAALCLQFSLDAAIRTREMHKHSRNLSYDTYSSRDTFATRSTM